MKKKLNVLIKKISDFKKRLNIGRKKIVVLLVLFLLASVLYYFKGLLVVAVVNNRPIWRLSVIRQLEKQGGKTTLDSLITEALILQESQRQKVVVSNEEIDEAIKQIEASLNKQGQNLDQLLVTQGLTRQDFRKQIRLQKIVEKILLKEIQVTEADIKTYYDENQSSFAKDKKFEDLKENIKGQLEQQKLQEKAQEWIQSLYDKAKINYFVRF